MSSLQKRIASLEAKVKSSDLFPEFGTVEYLLLWLKLPEEKRKAVRTPELTKDLDTIFPKKPIVINKKPLPEMDEEGNVTYRPDHGEVKGDPIFVGLDECSVAGMNIYEVADLLDPVNGRQMVDEYLGVMRPTKSDKCNT